MSGRSCPRPGDSARPGFSSPQRLLYQPLYSLFLCGVLAPPRAGIWLPTAYPHLLGSKLRQAPHLAPRWSGGRAPTPTAEHGPRVQKPDPTESGNSAGRPEGSWFASQPGLRQRQDPGVGTSHAGLVSTSVKQDQGSVPSGRGGAQVHETLHRSSLRVQVCVSNLVLSGGLCFPHLLNGFVP